VESGTIFDNFLIGDDATEAEAVAKETWEATQMKEKKMKAEIDEVEEKKEKEKEKEEEKVSSMTRRTLNG
jgi:pyruvate/2-oxoacid:ferredoxin oxidoreductase beta subunit